MTLEQIVCLAMLRIEVAPNSVIDPGDVDIRIANAVRAFLGSELEPLLAFHERGGHEGDGSGERIAAVRALLKGE